MVAKIIVSKNIRGMLMYNENKVINGQAKCIDENGYGCHPDNLHLRDKLKGLHNYADKNKRATAKAVHVSLSFHPDEQLDKERLASIATTYMDKIGFDEQPYLVYQHFDTHHPHVHVITTNITKEGTRILLYNIGRNQSEKARKEIEREYKLIPASGRPITTRLPQPFNWRKLQYGKTEVKRNVSDIVRFVTHTYKYSSLAELNAALQQFNVAADRGKEHSRMFNKGGLLYRIVDDEGNYKGVPLKASILSGKPTLAFLEKQFKLNKELKQPLKIQLRKALDEAIAEARSIRDYNNKMPALIKSLNKKNIHVLVRQNSSGITYGITLVDNQSKVVFNGSQLGKSYSIKEITQKIAVENQDSIWKNANQVTSTPAWLFQSGSHSRQQADSEKPLNELLTAQQLDYLSPEAALKMKRRKKRRGYKR